MILRGDSLDIKQEKINELKKVIPECIKDNMLDVEVLKNLFEDIIEDSIERYSFTWAGKSAAMKLAQSTTTGTLLPNQNESVCWDKTKNIFIEGDNLEVLKLIQKSYFSKIKLIYIDPPYNTDGDFVYPDNYTDNLQHYLETSGQIDKDGNKIGTNNESDGRYHSKWLSMMYPRLKLSRNLLCDDGLIIINIDEHEITNLQKLMAELYGESNELGTIIWDKRNPKGDAKGISTQHEYIVLYAKNKDAFLENNDVKRPKKNAEKILAKAKNLFVQKSETYTLVDINKDFSGWINMQKDFSGGEKAYNKIDINGDVYRPVSMAWPNKKQAPDEYFIPLIHPITKRQCPIPERGWRNPPATMKELEEKELILFGQDETTQPNRKYLLKENMYENIPSLLYYGGSDDDLLKEMGVPFDTPKSLDIVTEHILSFTKNDDIILDFFAGSATTAHAVYNANIIDGMRRSFILVQLPEFIAPTEIAYKKGFKKVSEISKKRIVEAGERYVNNNIDNGFKSFTLNSSNLKKWQPDYNSLENSLLDYVNNFVDDRSEEDVLYEIMLKMGLNVNLPIEKFEELNLYSIGYGALMISLSNEITESVAKKMIQLKNEYEPDTWKVVFKDNGFKSDKNKTNIMEILKSAGLDEDSFTTI